MVAFVLHLGNVTFANDDDNEGFAVVSSDDTLHIVDNVRPHTALSTASTLLMPA